MPGWQILNGYVELLSNRNVPMISGEVAYGTAQVGVDSKSGNKHRLSAYLCYLYNICHGSLVVWIPVELLLDDGCQLLVKSLQIGEAHQECVALRPDQLLRITQILQLAIAVLKPVI